MHLLRGNADLRAHAELTAVREARRGVDIDRRRVRLETERISYLESNDSEVWIHTSTGESLRTKTKISQWEQQLDDRFLRIHRSYIVNADRVARHTAGAVVVDGRTLEVSRKYRDSVRAAIPESAPSARVRHISNDKPS